MGSVGTYNRVASALEPYPIVSLFGRVGPIAAFSRKSDANGAVARQPPTYLRSSDLSTG